MIIEIDTSLANKLSDITMSQLVFLTLVLDENQNNHQDVHSLLSRVSEHEIQELIDKGWVSEAKTDTSTMYKPTESLIRLIGEPKDFFDEFYALYPVYVYRPDGTKSFLRINVNKCRLQYKKITGRSKATHEHIMQCLNFELTERIKTNKTGYMKTMWKWLVNHEWEAFEEQMQHTVNPETVKVQKIQLDGFA